MRERFNQYMSMFFLIEKLAELGKEEDIQPNLTVDRKHPSNMLSGIRMQKVCTGGP